MEMFDDLAVAAPSVEGQIARSDEDVALLARRKNGNLWMEHAPGDGYWLDFIVGSDTAGTLLAQAFADALHIREDERLRATAGTRQGVKYHRLKEGEAQCVRGACNALPWMGQNEIERRQVHDIPFLIGQIGLTRLIASRPPANPSLFHGASVKTALLSGRAESRCSGAIDLAAVSKFVELGGGVAQHRAIVRLAAALQLFDLWTEPDEVQPCNGVVDEG